VAVLVGVLGLHSSAWATTESTTKERLVGWSADGVTWVTEVLDYDRVEHEGGQPVSVALLVHVRNKVVARFGPNEITKVAARYPFERAHGPWRAAFKARLEILNKAKRAGDYEPCRSGWSVRDRRGGKILADRGVPKGLGACAYAIGGYVHTGGRAALVKYSESGVGNEHGCCDNRDTYLWVALPSTKPSSGPGAPAGPGVGR